MSKSTLTRKNKAVEAAAPNGAYQSLVGGVVSVIEDARRTAARSVNAAMTAAYWLIGRHILEFEQGGRDRGEYGGKVVERLAADLSRRYGRGFSFRNLWLMRAFYIAWPVLHPEQAIPEAADRKLQTVFAELSSRGETADRSAELGQAQKLQTASEGSLRHLAVRFRLPWSAYVRLLSVKNPNARQFYEAEALRGGWSVRQLDRQINSQFYERTALSKDKAKMLRKGERPEPADTMPPEAAIKDPFVLEFLNLKDEYSESDLEEALIRRLESFLMELGGDFCFIGRQRRLRIDDDWYRVDLVFFHRTLRCLILIDLKVGKFTHADAGQMHLYLNYAREHWANEHENPPVGLILCAQKSESLAHYALEGLPNKVMAAEYRTALPDEALLVAEIDRARGELDARNGHPAGVWKETRD